jgi:methanogenic corrinoid protein MtbC1
MRGSGAASLRSPPQGSGLLSIGALSSATGIPVETIRTWERRYGFPVPERKPSGHRVYPLNTIPRLKRAAQAIARGHRPAEVVPASERDLDALLDSLPEVQPSMPAERSTGWAAESSGGRGDLLEAVRKFDADQLRLLIRGYWARQGPTDFLEHTAAPFLSSVGRAWEQGDMGIRHEHFASGVLGDFLRMVRAPLEDRASGPVVALATLPGELHGLGLHMVALVFAGTGWRPLLLGVDTPIDQIAALARDARLGAVALSCVQAQRSSAARIRKLRRAMPRRIPLVVGGKGAPSRSPAAGVEIIQELTLLERWARSRLASA